MPTETIAVDAGRVVIGIGGLEVRCATQGLIITHALGSCLGIAIYDAKAKVGGMLHAQLPLSQLNPDRASENPALFVDLGIPLLFKMAVAKGANPRLLRVTVAGAANMMASNANDLFNIASRNLTVMKKVFWQQGVLLGGEDTGGVQPRTMTLRFDTGETLIESQGRRYTL
jgi:chemotaxis protein CheD